MTLERAREIIRTVSKGYPYDEDIPTGDVLRAICVLLERVDRG
jgi:hypothetical protein